jgi:hypothetical protein
MRYANGMDFQNDFKELLKTFARDMVNSLTTKDYVYFSSKENDDFIEFTSLLGSLSKDEEETISQETMDMMGGKQPVYGLRYSRLQMPSKPLLLELYNHHVEEILTIMLARRIPEILTEIATEYRATAKKLEVESKRLWYAKNKPPCSEKHDSTCTDRCNCNKSGKVDI